MFIVGCCGGNTPIVPVLLIPPSFIIIAGSNMFPILSFVPLFMNVVLLVVVGRCCCCFTLPLSTLVLGFSELNGGRRFCEQGALGMLTNANGSAAIDIDLGAAPVVAGKASTNANGSEVGVGPTREFGPVDETAAENPPKGSLLAGD